MAISYERRTPVNPNTILILTWWVRGTTSTQLLTPAGLHPTPHIFAGGGLIDVMQGDPTLSPLFFHLHAQRRYMHYTGMGVSKNVTIGDAYPVVRFFGGGLIKCAAGPKPRPLHQVYALQRGGGVQERNHRGDVLQECNDVTWTR